MIGSAWTVPVAAGLLGALAMTACLGPSLVDPRYIDWLMHGDYRLHFLGWHLYRVGPWTLPLGATPLLIWPIGSSVGLTDSIPILSFLFKVLDPFLPPTMQFIGLWLVLCFALQGTFGALLMRLATPRPLLQMLGAAMFILSPPLIFRIVHAALAAHWLLLAALWLSLREDADLPSPRLAAGWAMLCAVTAATQPYLLLMVAVLMVAAHARQVLASPGRFLRIAAHAVLALGAAGVALWQAGSFMVRAEAGLEIGGFGAWSTNLLSLVMPTEGSSLFAPGPFSYAAPEQYEGYAYLGAGTLLLGVVAVIRRARSIRVAAGPRPVRQHLPLLLGLLFLAAMALGPAITFGSRTVWTYDGSWWEPLTIFRTNGRMIWPAYYAIVAAILFGSSRLGYRRALAVTTLAVIVQAVDLAGMVRDIRDTRSYGFRDPLENRFWTVVAPTYERLVLVPTNLCVLEGFVDYSAFSLLAGRHGLAINAGTTARFDVHRAQAYCEDLDREIRQGPLSHESLYIVRPDLLRPLMKTRADSTCTVVDGFGVCSSKVSAARWQNTFDVARSRLPAGHEFIQFHQALDDIYRTELSRPVREAPGSSARRLEGLVRYLAYRMEGCGHAEAETRALEQALGATPPGLCGEVALRHELPPADQTYAFSTRFEEWLRGQPQAGSSLSHVDLEGEAVWLQKYAGERALGRNDRDARAAVLAAVRAAAR
ncbi:MAG: DUF6311 domain-containing protein [Acidobacteriota bacterium]